MKKIHVALMIVAAIAVVSVASFIFLGGSGTVVVAEVVDNDKELDDFVFVQKNDTLPIETDVELSKSVMIEYTGKLTGWSDKIDVQNLSGVVIFKIAIDGIPYDYIFRFTHIDNDDLNGYLKDGKPVIEVWADSGFTIELIRYDHRQYEDVKEYLFESYESYSDRNFTLPTYYGDSLFEKPSTERNMDLLAFALCLEMSSGIDGEDRAASVLKLLKDIGCANAVPNDTYSKEPTMESTDVAIGSKEWNGYNVIFLVMNGAKYKNEFASNVMIGGYGDHYGFSLVRDEGLRVLKEFIADNNITGKTKILVTGYSRTGAGSNLIAAYLSDTIAEGMVKDILGDIELTQEDLYGFSFETPLCGYYEEGGSWTSPTDPRYDNIWYVINEDDLVTYVPPKMYGFVRYGHQISDYPHDPAKSAGMLEIVLKRYNAEVAAAYDMSTFNTIGGFTYMSEFVDDFCYNFFTSLGDREFYYENVEYDFARFLYAVMSHDGLMMDIINEYGGPIVYVSDLYLYTNNETEFNNHFRPAVVKATQKYGCIQYTENILGAFWQVSELVKRYSDNDMYSMLTDADLLSMISNASLLLKSHMPAMVYGYVTQESDLYNF